MLAADGLPPPADVCPELTEELGVEPPEVEGVVLGGAGRSNSFLRLPTSKPNFTLFSFPFTLHRERPAVSRMKLQVVRTVEDAREQKATEPLALRLRRSDGRLEGHPRPPVARSALPAASRRSRSGG